MSGLQPIEKMQTKQPTELAKCTKCGAILLSNGRTKSESVSEGLCDHSFQSLAVSPPPQQPPKLTTQRTHIILPSPEENHALTELMSNIKETNDYIQTYDNDLTGLYITKKHTSN